MTIGPLNKEATLSTETGGSIVLRNTEGVFGVPGATSGVSEHLGHPLLVGREGRNSEVFSFL